MPEKYDHLIQRFDDNEFKVLVFFIRNSPHVISLPMMWKDMKNFLNNTVIPMLGMPIPIKFYSTQKAIEGVREDQVLGIIMMSEVAGIKIIDVPEMKEDPAELTRRAIEAQEKATRAIERVAEQEEQGDEWKKGILEGKCEHLSAFLDPDGIRKCLACNKVME